MRIVDNISKLDFNKLLSVNLLSVKDNQTFKNLIDNKYYIVKTSYLNKLYKSINLKSSRFVGDLYDIDNDFAISKITSNLHLLKYSLYYDDSMMYVFTDSTYQLFNKLIDRINSIDCTKYVFESDYYDNDSYLIIDHNNKGFYIEFSLLDESIVFYDAEILDNRLYIIYNSKFDLTDKSSGKFIDMYIDSYSNSKASMYYKDCINDILVWSEVLDYKKPLKFNLTDNEYEKLSNMTDIDKLITLSNYTSGDILKVINQSLSSIKLQNIMYIYDRFLNGNFKSRQLKNIFIDTTDFPLLNVSNGVKGKA